MSRQYCACSRCIAIQGAAVVSAALLVRRLDFRRQFYIDTVSYVVGYGGVAIALALLGHGVWSFVLGVAWLRRRCQPAPS